MTLTHRDRFTTWIREHAARADHPSEPDAPLDDLEPLRDIVGDARVVAIGENAHFIREFWRVRQRLLPGQDDGETIDRIRSQSSYMLTPLHDAFDAVLTLPSVTLDEQLGI